MPKGAITDEDREFVETWECVAASTYDVIKLDKRGDEVHELIRGHRTFFITTEERLITQDRIADVKHDPFLNGAFRPLVVPDSVSIDTNPNALSDDEILSIFVSKEFAWDEWMKVIDSPETLTRMVDLAEKTESDLSLKRYKQVQAKLAEVRPRVRVTQKDREQLEKMNPDDPANRTKQAGRSAQYRGGS